MMDNIVTIDESVVSVHTPETKQQSKQWPRKRLPGPIKAKIHATHSKQMVVAFFEATGLIYTNYMPRGTRVNANYIVGALGKFFKIFRLIRDVFSNETMFQFILPPLSEIRSPPKATYCWNNHHIHLSSPMPTVSSSLISRTRCQPSPSPRRPSRKAGRGW